MIVLKINKAGPQIHIFREIGMNVWQSPLLGGWYIKISILYLSK